MSSKKTENFTHDDSVVVNYALATAQCVNIELFANAHALIINENIHSIVFVQICVVHKFYLWAIKWTHSSRKIIAFFVILFVNYYNHSVKVGIRIREVLSVDGVFPFLAEAYVLYSFECEQKTAVTPQ